MSFLEIIYISHRARATFTDVFLMAPNTHPQDLIDKLGGWLTFWQMYALLRVLLTDVDVFFARSWILTILRFAFIILYLDNNRFTNYQFFQRNATGIENYVREGVFHVLQRLIALIQQYYKQAREFVSSK